MKWTNVYKFIFYEMNIECIHSMKQYCVGLIYIYTHVSILWWMCTFNGRRCRMLKKIWTALNCLTKNCKSCHECYRYTTGTKHTNKNNKHKNTLVYRVPDLIAISWGVFNVRCVNISNTTVAKSRLIQIYSGLNLMNS